MRDIVEALTTVPNPGVNALLDKQAEQARQREATAELHARVLAPEEPEPEVTAPQPISRDDRSQNPLRPTTLDEIIGQERAKRMMRRVIDTASAHGERMDHCLLVGPAGTGKTTFANVIAVELNVDCYQVSAPVSFDTLLALREVMKDGDILFVDEIHMQAVMERRGSESISAPEVFLQLLEDFVIATPVGMLPFPQVTVIGATTDPGRLPDPFLDRFPLQPRLQEYDPVELARMAVWNTEKLKLTITTDAALTFALAARGTPRIVNNYVKNARSIAPGGEITQEIAEEVLLDLMDVSLDGLTHDQRAMLTFMYRFGGRKVGEEMRYQASVSSIATGIGLSRDQKAVQFRVEPYLIQRGYIQVGHGGRVLTDAGIARAIQLLTEVETS